MRLLDAWAAMPQPERTAKLRALRLAAWLTLCQRADRLALILYCAEAACSEAWEAANELLNAMPTLMLRKLLRQLAEMQAVQR